MTDKRLSQDLDTRLYIFSKLICGQPNLAPSQTSVIWPLTQCLEIIWALQSYRRQHSMSCSAGGLVLMQNIDQKWCMFSLTWTYCMLTVLYKMTTMTTFKQRRSLEISYLGLIWNTIQILKREYRSLQPTVKKYLIGIYKMKVPILQIYLWEGL